MSPVVGRKTKVLWQHQQHKLEIIINASMSLPVQVSIEVLILLILAVIRSSMFYGAVEDMCCEHCSSKRGVLFGFE